MQNTTLELLKDGISNVKIWLIILLISKTERWEGEEVSFSMGICVKKYGFKIKRARKQNWKTKSHIEKQQFSVEKGRRRSEGKKSRYDQSVDFQEMQFSDLIDRKH